MKYIFGVVLLLSVTVSKTYQSDDESNPFLDMASAFLQDTLANQNNGGGGIASIASVVGSLMQGDGASGKSSGDGAAQILSGIGSLLASAAAGGNNQAERENNAGGGGFDPSMIINMVSMFAGMNQNTRSKRNTEQESPMASMLSLASTFMQNMNNVNNDHGSKKQEEGGIGDTVMNMLPMVMQAINSFSGPEMEKVENRHKEHSKILPPFLEYIHIIWDQFQTSELAQALFVKLGLSQVFKGFVARDGKMDYDKLFESLENQSFRRRWIKQALVYLSDWANYLSNPEVYQRYIATGQIMANGFLKNNGYPDSTLLDITRPSETLSNLIDHTVRKQLNVKISSIMYVKPAVQYIKEILRLGKARELLQKLNATEISDKLTDTLNLEVIEPMLKVHRAYRFALDQPECDRYVLCEINSHDPNEELGLGGFKSGVTKFGSMAAAWFISSETHTPFWTLFATINDPYKCQKKFPIDCTGFHDGEARVTTEYIHNEL